MPPSRLSVSRLTLWRPQLGTSGRSRPTTDLFLASMSRELSSPQRVATWLWLFKGPFFRSASRANLTTAPETISRETQILAGSVRTPALKRVTRVRRTRCLRGLRGPPTTARPLPRLFAWRPEQVLAVPQRLGRLVGSRGEVGSWWSSLLGPARTGGRERDPRRDGSRTRRSRR
jgi:hypothetical protein